MKKRLTIIYTLLLVIIIIYPPVKWELYKTSLFELDMDYNNLNSYTDIISAFSENETYKESFKTKNGDKTTLTVTNPKINWVRYVLQIIIISIIFFGIFYFSNANKPKDSINYGTDVFEKQKNLETTMNLKSSHKFKYKKIVFSIILILVLSFFVLMIVNVIEQNNGSSNFTKSTTNNQKSSTNSDNSQNQNSNVYYFDDIIRVYPNIESDLRNADEEQKVHNYRGAIKGFLKVTKAIPIDKHNAIIYMTIGKCYDQLFESNIALSYYNKAIQLCPDHPNIRDWKKRFNDVKNLQ